MKYSLTIPYIEVLPLRFGMTEDDVTSLIGFPIKRLTTRKGELDYRYADCSIRFSKDEKKFVEVGFFPSADIIIDGKNLFKFPEYHRILIEKDGDALEYVGVLFLPKFGITLTGFHDSNPSEQSITAFKQGRLDHIIHNFRPFKR